MKFNTDFEDIKSFLDEKYLQYNNPFFIEHDPVSIPHQYRKKQDIEIAGFLAATIAWGQRPVIIRNANRLLSYMDNDPHRFILNFKKSDLKPFAKFAHRTFNGTDCIYFLNALKKIYTEFSSLEQLFKHAHTRDSSDYLDAIAGWRNFFFKSKHLQRTEKHFANPETGSAAKKINMFLRWMIRRDSQRVDFGIWKMDAALLTCPLDVHSARVARKLGLMERKNNDWTAAVELTNNLRLLDKNDPVKYDFALFGLGVFENF